MKQPKTALSVCVYGEEGLPPSIECKGKVQSLCPFARQSFIICSDFKLGGFTHFKPNGAVQHYIESTRISFGSIGMPLD